MANQNDRVVSGVASMDGGSRPMAFPLTSASACCLSAESILM